MRQMFKNFKEISVTTQISTGRKWEKHRKKKIIGDASQGSDGRPGMRTRRSNSAVSGGVTIRQKVRRDYPDRTGWRNYREDLGGFHLLRYNTEEKHGSHSVIPTHSEAKHGVVYSSKDICVAFCFCGEIFVAAVVD